MKRREKPTEDLVWKKKSVEVKKYIMLFFIRFSEALTASIIPSIIGICTIMVTPSPTVMMLMAFVSFCTFSTFSCIFWTRYVKHRPKAVEFFIMNGIVYSIYIGLSVLGFRTGDPYFYTMVFSNLRGFELFGATTIISMIIAHSTALVMLIICYVAGTLYYKYQFENMSKNAADKIEMKVKKKAAVQGDEEVEFLTVEEVTLEWQREIEEAWEMVQDEYESEDGSVWDKGMVQGRGKKVEETLPEDYDNDIDEDDYISVASLENQTKDESEIEFDEDALWNDEIYVGRERTEEYEDEDFFVQYAGEQADTDPEEPMWQGMKKGADEEVEFIGVGENDDDDEEAMDFEAEYEQYENWLNRDIDEEDEPLWDEMYHGKGKDVEKDLEIDDEEYFDKPRWLGDEDVYIKNIARDSGDDEDDEEEGWNIQQGREDSRSSGRDGAEAGKDGAAKEQASKEFDMEEFDEDELFYIDDDYENRTEAFYINYSNNPDQNSYEDYDDENLWGDMTQGK